MEGLAAQISYESLRTLVPDRANPRLPEGQGLQSWDTPDAELFAHIARHHSAAAVAQSIADFGFFASEPLITVPGRDKLIVVEGNRRLTALYGLADPKIRATFPNSARWDEWAEQAQLTLQSEVAVLRADDRKAVEPLIGYRHIAGIKKWDAYARARYVARMIDVEGESFQGAAELVGVTTTSVKSFYRNVAILRQAGSDFGMDVEAPEQKFGVFTAALNRTAIRDYVGAPGPADVDRLVGEHAVPPVPEDHKARLGQLLGWLFSNEYAKRVIDESRDIARLAKILAEEAGADELVRTGSLESAEVAAGLHEQEFVSRLQTARVSLEAALNDIPASVNGPTGELLDECDELISAIRRQIIQ